MRRTWRRRLQLMAVGGALGSLLLGGQAVAAPGGNSWSVAGGDRQNTRFAAGESKISAANVSGLVKKWEFTTGAQDPPEVLYPLYDAAVARAHSVVAAALEDRGLDGDSGVRLPDGSRASIRRILFDRIEEYARHLGHLDLLREAIDGRVGEDPPGDWQQPGR